MLRSGPAAMMMIFFSNPKKDLEHVHFFWQIFIHICIDICIYMLYTYIYIYTYTHVYIYICQKHRFARCFSLPIDF